MKPNYVEFSYDGETARRTLKDNQSKTNMTCPYDFAPVVLEQGTKFDVYECVLCHARYETPQELKDAGKAEMEKAKSKIGSLEKCLRNVRSEIKLLKNKK